MLWRPICGAPVWAVLRQSLDHAGPPRPARPV